MHWPTVHLLEQRFILVKVRVRVMVRVRVRVACVTQKCFNIYMLNKICYSVQMLCFSYTAYPLPGIVCRICLFDSFEKLSIVLGILRDILEGWARGYCLHVFLVNSMRCWRAHNCFIFSIYL